MKNKFALCVIIFLPQYFSVHAAGFNCSLTSLNETEKTICQTPYLSGLDNVANELFISATNNTLSKGVLLSDQNQWLKERNSCKADVECIKHKYLLRNSTLSSIEPFEPVASAFPASLIDEPFGHEIKNKNGFVIRDNPWLIKDLFRDSQKERSLNIPTGYWKILTHLDINNSLEIIFTVETENITYLVLISDTQSYIIDSYDNGSASAPRIKLIEHDDAGFIYKVIDVYNPNKKKRVSAYYQVTVDGNQLMAPQKLGLRPEFNETNENEQWTGYCGQNSCSSQLISPDGLWRIASGDGDIKYRNDGIYIFPSDRPDRGINVFISSAEDTEEDWGFSRNYAWGDKDSFFFDNDGAMACIWKTDINKKTTERILPVEGLQQPYYLRYNNHDYVIARYISINDSDKHMVGFYIAKSEH